MASIPNTKRRGAIYWFRRSCRLPNGNLLRPTVSLRTACPKTARQRAAVLTAKFEELYMRLFGSSERRFALDADAAARIFKKEFNRALDALEQERELSTLPSYEFGNIATFLTVHEEIYRYLAETGGTDDISAEEWHARTRHLGQNVFEHSYSELEHLGAIFSQQQDETAEVLEEEGVVTDIWYMDHARRLRFEARLAAIQEYRRRLEDPTLRFESYLHAPPPAAPMVPSAPAATSKAPSIEVSQAAASVEGGWATLTAEQTAAKFIDENPKLLGSASGKRGAKWTPKTKSQFETAMRLLQKSMGEKPFVELSNDDLRQLLRYFDGLPPNHHKSPRHGPMSLAEICDEAQDEVRAGNLDADLLGLNVPTLNRHFRFIRMAHDWVRRHVPQISPLDWSAFSFDDTRNAREQRQAFPITVAEKIFALPPWQGCANARQRLKPGQHIFHDSLYWVLPIIWYSGMRREEACKLRVLDVATSDQGIMYFDVADTEAGRLKTTNSRRLIPVADELLRLGFADFVQIMADAGQDLLFPELVSDTRNMGDTYYRLSWNKIVASLDEKPTGLTIHGIRHMVADELKAAGISEEIRADLLGHALQSETAGRYSKASRLETLRMAVNTIPAVTSSVERATIRRP